MVLEIKNRRSYCRPPRRMSLVEEAMQFGGPAPWASRDAVWRRRGQEVLLDKGSDLKIVLIGGIVFSQPFQMVGLISVFT